VLLQIAVAQTRYLPQNGGYKVATGENEILQLTRGMFALHRQNKMKSPSAKGRPREVQVAV